MGRIEAINSNKEIMFGYKWNYFVLCLTFIGWSLLYILTIGIGFFWLMSYTQNTFAEFYLHVKKEYEPGKQSLVIHNLKELRTKTLSTSLETTHAFTV